MTNKQRRVAIVFPADASQGRATRIEQSRLAGIADAFAAAGAEVIGTPFADEFADETRARLRDVDAVLVWFNPFEGGRNRAVLNQVLADAAARGAMVSAHPEAIDKIGTKQVLYRTRGMSWGGDTRHYASWDALRDGLPASLRLGPRVLKQMRGQSGDGIWRVEAAREGAAPLGLETPLRVRHAKRGCVEDGMSMASFLALCRAYFADGGGMIDQPFQPRLNEGMVRCYMVGDRVAGFGEQLINALYPAQAGASPNEAPQPGPRLYFPPTRPDFQRLKEKLEREWIAELCRLAGLQKPLLPVLWDADFLYGPKDAGGDDSYVLCEINVSSVYPFPPSALAPMVAQTMARIAR